LGYFFFLIGTLFLFVPLTYLELGRPKDLIKAFLNFLIGFILTIKNKNIENPSFIILILLMVLEGLYLAEIFASRWNELTEAEKNKLTTFLELKNNLSKTLEAINLGVRNSAKPLKIFNFDRKNQSTSQKKWVKNDKNDNIKD
tara:strand:- start:498 stop:926 length:429 start_codon:yes stop_codon:yes gene_type:complete